MNSHIAHPRTVTTIPLDMSTHWISWISSSRRVSAGAKGSLVVDTEGERSVAVPIAVSFVEDSERVGAVEASLLVDDEDVAAVTDEVLA